MPIPTRGGYRWCWGCPDGVLAWLFDLDGGRDFLASRGIILDEGAPDDPATALTVHGLGNRKNEELARRIAEDGVEVFEGSRRYLQAAQRPR